MKSYEDLKWNSQILLTQYDRAYGTDGYIRISITNNTKDYLVFSQAMFNISISNQLNKLINLNIQDSSDLLESFVNIIKNLQTIYKSNDYQILKRYNKGNELLFEFFKNNKNENLVKISIISNETDKTNIIIELNTFIIICKRLKYYVNNYDEICMNLPNNLLQKELLKTNMKLHDLFKRFPSELGIFNENKTSSFGGIQGGTNSDVATENGEMNDIHNINEEIKNEGYLDNNVINELDNFLGNNMSNINVSELETTIDVETNQEVIKENIQEFKSIIFNSFDNKLKEIENFLTFAQSTDNPFEYIINELEKNKFKKEVKLLPKIDDKDYKSLCYLTYLNTSIFMKKSIEYNKPLPVGFPLFKYKINSDDLNSDNIDIAYDLLLINIYLKKMRSLIESKVDDIISNKSLVYLLFRFYFDPITFGILENIKDRNVLKNNIISRFKYYKSIGMFDDYEQELEFNNCVNVNENDIVQSLDVIIDKVLYSDSYIKDKHDLNYEKNIIVLSYDNNMDLNKITSEIVPIESFKQSGFDLNNIQNWNECEDQDVKKLFVEPKKSKFNKIKIEKKVNDNLIRIVKQYEHQIPEKIKNDFINYINELDDKDVNMKELPFPLEILGDEIIKILYLWKPSEDEKIITNYRYLFESLENMIMTKDLILTNVNYSDESIKEEKDVDEWSNAF